MKDLLCFKTMVTPRIITGVYWLMLVSVLLSGLGTMFSHHGGFLPGIVVLVGGAIGARITCELLIILFKINENLQKIANKG